MATVKRFEELEVRQDARQLVQAIYLASRQRAVYRDSGLREQIRRASISILSNIAEGFERGTKRDFVHFLNIAKASSGEVRAQLYAALDQHYLSQQEFLAIRESLLTLSRKLASFIGYLERNAGAGRTNRSTRRAVFEPATCNLQPAAL